MRLYYLIWVDLIIRAKTQPANKNNWQVMTLLYMSVVMAVDLLFLMVILQEVMGYYFYTLEIQMLPHAIGGIISFIILFVVPPLVLNYIQIFRNRRYNKLIKRYKYHDGKLAGTCMLLGLFIPVIVLLFGMIYCIVNS